MNMWFYIRNKRKKTITQVQKETGVNRIYEIVGEPNVYNYSSFKWFMTKED